MASKFERLLKKEFADYQYFPRKDFRGSDECFSMNAKALIQNRIEKLFVNM